MKPEDNNQAQQTRLSEGMRLIFDQESSSSRSSSYSSSTDSSYSSKGSSYGSHGSRRHRHRRRSHSSSSSDSSSSSSDSRSHSRSRSRPRCHRTSDRYRCRHEHRSPPHRHRGRSRSYSPSPDHSSHRRHRGYSRSSSRSSSRGRYSRRWRRSSSRSSGYRRRFVGRYRCRFSPSPRRSCREYRSRSRSPQRSAVRLSQKEKMDLLNIAKENAIKILGVQNLQLPTSVKTLEQRTDRQEKKPESYAEERVKGDAVLLKKPAQDRDVTNEDNVVRTSPPRKPITFSITNTIAKPPSSPTFHVTESKVTSRADSVGNRKPYGQWVPVKKASPNKH